MQLFIRDMNEMTANEILDWKYEAPFDFYNNERNNESLHEILENDYYAVVNDKEEIVGFYCIGVSAQVPIGAKFDAYIEDMVDIGIGMKPELTGLGFGSTFFSFVLNHIRTIYTNKFIRLTVATFNKRAIHLYEQLGFEKKMQFRTDSTEFITMGKHFE